MEMRILMRKHLAALAIIFLSLLGGSGVGRAQNKERLGKATNTTSNGSEQSGSRQTPADNLQDEIAKILRLHYDAWTKLDATLVNGNFTDNGFVSSEGKMIPSMLRKVYSVVLDVPSEARNIFLGVLLNGKGQIWAADLTFEVVEGNVAVTNNGSAEGVDDPVYAKIPKATIKRPINRV